ncbi:HlyD family efflux transporter periplasmic adaptor subunit [Ilyomonas limi]|uniref:HlyD family efflux transporter periplasmic adaptor subunit n=1 Tax=Ilyomonas limi TaxID=2575867 RepID=A0A4U3LCU0_9BACT|nr:HlyD family efflux transporter periplasmic adaptor subunit [Ilyomonas limi]TKK71886.1 HlyD family efflux transporter periplasmic adaptor subunit [Ilyomonas limi]
MITDYAILYGEDYPVKTQRFILWFFRLLLLFVLISMSLLFTVRINDTVSFAQGEIISQSPQLNLKAPFEAQLSKMYVREGQKVRTGDTLMVIYNEANSRAYTAQKAEREYLEKKLASVQSLLAALSKKKSETGVENSINSSDRNVDVQNIQNNILTLDAQYKLQQQKLNNALERNRADSILYQKDMLSKIEYNASKDLVNDIRESVNIIKSELQKQKVQQQLSANEFASKQHQLALKNIALEENNQSLRQLQIDLENELIKANENLELLSHELAKQYLIANTNGTVNFIFTSKQTTNLINKNDLLLSISPDKNDFYAKVVLPENDMQYVKTTMRAHLQLDAYYHLEYGIIQGNVTYISARKENDKFYAFIKLNNAKNFQLKSGYNVSGEIITDKLVLFRYFIKKIFKDFDKKPS